MQSLNEVTNKHIGFVGNLTQILELEQKYNDAELQVIKHLNDLDRTEYKKAYRKLKGLEIELDKLHDRG